MALKCEPRTARLGGLARFENARARRGGSEDRGAGRGFVGRARRGERRSPLFLLARPLSLSPLHQIPTTTPPQQSSRENSRPPPPNLPRAFAQTHSLTTTIIPKNMTMLLHHLGYAVKQALKNPFTFVLGSFTCLLVVTVAATLQSVLSKAPAVFLQEAEHAKGELDLELKPGTDWEFLKTPSVDAKLAASRGPQTSGIASFHAPRLYYGNQRLYRPEACSDWASDAAAVGLCGRREEGGERREERGGRREEKEEDSKSLCCRAEVVPIILVTRCTSHHPNHPTPPPATVQLLLSRPQELPRGRDKVQLDQRSRRRL